MRVRGRSADAEEGQPLSAGAKALDRAAIERLESEAIVQEVQRRRAAMTRRLLIASCGTFALLLAGMIAFPEALGQPVLGRAVTLGMLLAFAVLIAILLALGLFVHGANTKLEPLLRRRTRP